MQSKEEIEKAIAMFENLDMGNDEEFKRARNRILKELERLQEKNRHLNIIILKDYISKFAIENKLEQDKANYIDAIKADNKVEAVQKYIEYLEKELLEGK